LTTILDLNIVEVGSTLSEGSIELHDISSQDLGTPVIDFLTNDLDVS
jgi:hypothetical protein